MSLGLFPVRFTVQDVTIAEDPAFTSSFPFTQAKQLDIRVTELASSARWKCAGEFHRS